MKCNHKFALIAFLISSLFFSLSAQEFNFYNAEKKIIFSKSVDDTVYVFISVPNGYNDSE